MMNHKSSAPDRIIPFHTSFTTGQELERLKAVFENTEFQGGYGMFTKKCESFLQSFTGSQRVLLTSSCTHALEMCALLLDIHPSDEVIMPSFNFVSAANAFVLRGAVPVFVDIDSHTLNITAENIEKAITNKTKAIVVMHYGGVSCDMRRIMDLADAHGLPVIEDAAHCIDAYDQGKHLGSIGDLGTLSFHATKNIHCGEGGALLVNNPKYLERAEFIRDKGTNRSQFNKKIVNKYTWVDIGSSYVMSEITAAFLYEQLTHVHTVTQTRLQIFGVYKNHLSDLLQTGDNRHNAHIAKLLHPKRDQIIAQLKKKNIESHFHYVPLHLSPMGKKFGRFSGSDRNTCMAGDQLFRLPIYPSLRHTPYIAEVVSETLKKFN